MVFLHFHKHFVLLVFLSIALGHATAQPSLMADDRKELTINYNGSNETFTVMQDALQSNQWYFVPKSPNLSEIEIDGVKNPEFTLLRYQFVDPNSPDHSFDGGVAQFSIQLNPSAEEIQLLRDQLVIELNSNNHGSNIQANSISFAPLPLKASSALIYSPSDNKLVSNNFGNGMFPLFASQKAPFVLYLTKWGADMNDALIGSSVASNTGIPVAITLTFQGLTPPAKLHVHANYRKIFQHYSSDRTFAAKASYFGLFGASTQMRWSAISEKLSQDGSLVVTKIDNGEIDQATMDAVMQTIMKRINDQIFQTLAPPPSIPPATAEMPSLNDRFFSAGYNATYKEVSQISSLDDDFDWTERKIVDRSTLVGGFIGLGKYPPEIRARAVKFVPTLNWDLAHLILPDVGAIQKLTKVIVSTQLLSNDQIMGTSEADWNPQSGWLSIPDNRPTGFLDFSIAPLLQNGIDPKSLKFVTTTTVTQDGRNTELIDTQKVVQGGIPVAPPSNGLTTISFDPSGLLFKNLASEGRLLRVAITVTVGIRTFSDKIQPIIQAGQFQAPQGLVWVFKNDDVKNNPVRVSIKYDYVQGANPLSRRIDIADLKDIEPSLDYLLRDPSL